MKKNNTGRNSLIISVFGLIVIQVLITTHYIVGWYWHILLAGFEAATIGGFADWFAVKALFREIPILFIKRHTNIIVKNRAKISTSIVDLVTTQWLSPIVIKEKLSNISISNKLITYLKGIENSKITSFIASIPGKFMESTDINSLVSSQIEKLDLGHILGGFLEKHINSPMYNDLWSKILGATQKSIQTEETKKLLQVEIQKQIDNYKDESFFKKLMINVGKGSKAIDTESIVDKLVFALNDFIEDAKSNPDSELKIKMDNYFMNFADKLTNKDKDVEGFIDSIKTALGKVSWNTIVNDIISSENTTGLLVNQFNKLLVKVENDEKIKSSMDDYIMNIVGQLLEQSQSFIGKMVLDSLDKLNDEELVAQIEDKVGDDLQYIRLNGAIVGGFVGVIIAIIRHSFNLAA